MIAIIVSEIKKGIKMLAKSDQPKNGHTVTRQPKQDEGYNLPVFYTNSGFNSLPKMGVTVAETSEFVIIRDNETNAEVACHKSDYDLATELSDVYDSITSFVYRYETPNCTFVLKDEQMNELLDFLKVVLKYTK
jgi:hypothetical protein